MTLNPNIIKFITIIVIILAFTGIIYAITTVFATKCPDPDRQHYDPDQKKCIDTCTDDEVYDNITQKCRPICTGSSVWSDSLQLCKDCGIGSKWNESTQSCSKSCDDNSQCESGKTCVNSQCCDYPSCKTAEGEKCCKECSPDPNKPDNNLCCSSEQICNIGGVTICCTGSKICNGTTCIDPCGTNLACKEGQKCFQIKNVINPSNMYTKLSTNPNNQSEKNTDGTYNFYSCIDDKNRCTSGNSYSVPASLNNIYPCFDVDKTNTDAGLGFCSYNTDITKINDCIKNSSESSCTPNADCKWYDILSYQDDAKLNNVISQTFNEGNGYYCGDNTKNLSRLYGVNFDTSNNCGYEDCLAFTANPSVTDVYYDATTGKCTSLQSCTTLSDLGTNIPNKSLYNILPKSCDNKTPLCIDMAKAGQVCDSTTGLIQKIGYNCINGSLINQDGTCKCLDKNTAGTNCQFTRTGTCSGLGYPQSNGTCICDLNSVLTDSGGCTRIETSKYFETGAGWHSGVIYQWFMQFLSNVDNCTPIFRGYEGLAPSWFSDNAVGWQNLFVLKINDPKYVIKSWTTDEIETLVWTWGPGNPDYEWHNYLVTDIPKKNINNGSISNMTCNVFPSTKQDGGNYLANFMMNLKSDPTSNLVGFTIRDMSKNAVETTSPLPYKFFPTQTFFQCSPAILILYGSKYLDGTN